LLPYDIKNNQTILKVVGDADVTNATINIGIWGGNSFINLTSGEAVKLIDADNLVGTGKPGTFTASQGSTLKYDFTIYQDADILWAKLGGFSTGGTGGTGSTSGSVSVVEGTKTLSEGFLSGLVSTNLGGEISTGAAFQAIQAGGTGGVQSFGSVDAVHVRANTGSHVDVDGYSLVVGASYGLGLGESSKLTLGGFFEYGNHDYDTYNSFPGASLKGKGNSTYTGGGLMAGTKFTQDGGGFAHVELALRAGHIKTDFRSTQLQDLTGVNASYDSSSTYYGVVLGGGKTFAFTQYSELDVYGKLFYTRQNGDTVNLSTGEEIKFSAVSSKRARAGARYSHTLDNARRWTLYGGLAYEHEFDSKAKAKINGQHKIDSPDMKGGTGILEAGVRLKPKADGPFSLNLSVQGFSGKHQGVAGGIQAKLAF
jgi:hypothetical protein